MRFPGAIERGQTGPGMKGEGARNGN